MRVTQLSGDVESEITRILDDRFSETNTRDTPCEECHDIDYYYRILLL